jgi:hypothetical protein
MENNKVLPNEIEEVLSSIPGVLSSKVVLENDNIEEIHIMATTERNPKQISRDIQSIMIARFDIDLDYKKISIAQIHESSIKKSDRRIEVEEISINVNGSHIKAGVKLLQDGVSYHAEEEGLNTVTNSYRIIANTTLKALQQIIRGSYVFTTEDVERITIGKKEVMVVAISIVNYHKEEMLVGTAVVKGDFKETIIRATLDAVNRRLARLLI